MPPVIVITIVGYLSDYGTDMSASASSSASAYSGKDDKHSLDSDTEVIDLTQELLVGERKDSDLSVSSEPRRGRKRKAALIDDEVGEAKERKAGPKGMRHFIFTHWLDGMDEKAAAAFGEGLCKCLKEHAKVARFCFQLEKAPDTGRLHLQGYVGLKNGTTMTFDSCRANLFANVSGSVCWIKQARAPKEAFEYCEKEKSRVAGPWKHGEKPKPGSRTDLKQFVADAKAKLPLAELQEKHMSIEAHSMKYFDRVIQRTRSDPVRRFKTRCVIWWGDAGTGKTYRVKQWVEQELKMDWNEHVYCPMVAGDGKQTWWDGYAGQHIVFFDEFAPKCMPISLFKNLAGNDTPVKVQTKGGSVQFRALWLVLCSNGNPRTWWGMDKPENDHEKKAVARRVTECKWFQYGPIGLADLERAWEDPVIVDDNLLI